MKPINPRPVVNRRILLSGLAAPVLLSGLRRVALGAPARCRLLTQNRTSASDLGTPGIWTAFPTAV